MKAAFHSTRRHLLTNPLSTNGSPLMKSSAASRVVKTATRMELIQLRAMGGIVILEFRHSTGSHLIKSNDLHSGVSLSWDLLTFAFCRAAYPAQRAERVGQQRVVRRHRRLLRRCWLA